MGLLVANEELTKPREPRVGGFDHPAPRALAPGARPALLPARAHMRGVGSSMCWCAAAPTKPASAHRCWRARGPTGGRSRTTASRVGVSSVMSFRLAPVTMIDSGTPRASTSSIRLLPFFSPVSGVGPHRLLCQRRLQYCPVDALPSPGDALHLVILGQPACHSAQEHTRLLPLQKPLVDGARAAEALAGSAFHWQPVRSTYTIASNTCRGSSVCARPRLARERLRAGRPGRSGTSGSTRAQNASETSHESNLALVISTLRPATVANGRRVYIFIYG